MNVWKDKTPILKISGLGIFLNCFCLICRLIFFAMISVLNNMLEKDII